MSLSKKQRDAIHFVNASEVLKHSAKYSKILARVLDYCYGTDYPGASLDEKQNHSDILSGKQKTVFWAITDDDKKKGKFGTSSMVDVRHEFGNGFAEMGKSGSLGSRGSKYGYARFIKDWEQKKSGLSSFSSILTTVRNCAERPGKKGKIIKAGVGVRILFLKYLKFEQWGIAPWYLMPDHKRGSYEVLDLLLRFRMRQRNVHFFKTEKVSLYFKRDQEMLKKFVALNYKTHVLFDGRKSSEEKKGWKLLEPSLKKRQNPQMLISDDSNNTAFELLFEKMSLKTSSTDIITAPLISSTLGIQKNITRKGFVLVGFIPGNKKGNVVEPCKGMWAKLKTTQDIIYPLYVDKNVSDEFSPTWYFQWVQNTIKKLDQNRVA